MQAPPLKETMKKFIKLTRFYLKHKRHVNAWYGWALNKGHIHDETLNWKQRTEYFLHCE